MSIINKTILYLIVVIISVMFIKKIKTKICLKLNNNKIDNNNNNNYNKTKNELNAKYNEGSTGNPYWELNVINKIFWIIVERIVII